ncbi:matrix metalloproteinase-14-like [Paramacrobiotus metropolitanus]|uniref:matrix metalloproteinase-14-like n=1 Tax=Paramacrobiotus metropolitanus TaxID=2943436 RepID=UPI00244613B6|nr:matrix metalloproteinase-14-like [Paramacrobiotus metropolitanus]
MYSNRLQSWTFVVVSCLIWNCISCQSRSRNKRMVWIGVQYQPQLRPSFPQHPHAGAPLPDDTLSAVAGATVAPHLSPDGHLSPHICSADFVPDVFAQTGDGNTYVFADDVYWHIMDFEGNVVDNRQLAGQPIGRDWSGLPNKPDAAITLADGQTLFFKDDRFYVFWNKSPREPYSGLIEQAFPQIPRSNLDAAFMTNTSLIFVKGDSFYVFGIEQFPFVQRGNLADMGLPALPVETAVNLSDGLAYIVIDKTAYQVDTISLQVVSSFPTQSLYGCLEPLMSAKTRMLRIPYGRKFDPEKDYFRGWTAAALNHHVNIL